MVSLDHVCLWLPKSLHCEETEATYLKRALGGIKAGDQGSIVFTPLQPEHLQF